MGIKKLTIDSSPDGGGENAGSLHIKNTINNNKNKIKAQSPSNSDYPPRPPAMLWTIERVVKIIE